MCTRLKQCCWGGTIGILLAFVVPGLVVFAPPLGISSFLAISPPPLSTPSYQDTYSVLQNPWAIKPEYVGNIDEETLWLARAMFSESKRHDEQELIGWIVRNRLHTKFHGCNSYRECVLAPAQFSAFLPGQPKLNYYTSLVETTQIPGWQKTLALAFYIRHADDRLRPFSSNVRHFYSEQSMLDPELPPDWVGDADPVYPQRNIRLDERRFRFYAGLR
ncbi:MAG: hypothetical protein OXF48_00195 [Bacteroidetes bacterium]|nr:hypothetical protein [Bacteroidota bacterium]